jgi:hypothetical protein
MPLRGHAPPGWGRTAADTLTDQPSANQSEVQDKGFDAGEFMRERERNAGSYDSSRRSSDEFGRLLARLTLWRARHRVGCDTGHHPLSEVGRLLA